MAYVFPIEGVNYQEKVNNLVLNNSLLIEDGLFVSQDLIRFDIEDFGIFDIENGKDVYFSSYNIIHDPVLLDAYLQGPVLGALLLQRKILAFHASAILYKGKGILFCGESGVGKSTSAFTFCQDNALLLNDDISPILFCKDSPIILAFSESVRLWKDNLTYFDQQIAEKSIVWSENEKTKYKHEVNSTKQKVELSTICIIELGEAFKLDVLNKNEALFALRKQIYREGFLRNMIETEKDFFQKIVNLTNNCLIIKVTRPESFSPFLLKKELVKLL
jgi:hypothetical protein